MQAENEIEGHKSLYTIVFTFCVKNLASWLSASRDPMGHSPFGSLSLQRPSIPIRIAVYFG